MKKVGLLLAILVLVSASSAIAAETGALLSSGGSEPTDRTTATDGFHQEQVGDSALLEGNDFGEAVNETSRTFQDLIHAINCEWYEFLGELDEDGCYTPRACNC